MVPVCLSRPAPYIHNQKGFNVETDISGRQRMIMDYIREEGSVQVDELSVQLKVTQQTIRKDLNHLSECKLVQRVRGGAVLKNTVENLGYGARKILMAEEKTEIARATSKIITDNSSMFINLGTTTERVSQFLVNHNSILVITNNINVAGILWPSRNIEVMVAGGTIRHIDGGIIGSSTEEFISSFKLDYAIIGCSAIDDSGEILEYDLREVRVTKAIIRQARIVILVTDSMKMKRTAPVKVGTLEDIDILVTDNNIAPEFMDLCLKNNVDVRIVKPSVKRD
jgi:DeoR family glycerol-3-phosphate regulon repressor